MFLAADNYADRVLFGIMAAGQSTDRQFVFLTSCVRARGEDIDAMTDDDNHQKVTLRTLRKHCNTLNFEKEMEYARHWRHGLMLVNDWHVSFWKSTYRGVPCYYIDHSRIEYIWVDKDKWEPELVEVQR